MHWVARSLNSFWGTDFTAIICLLRATKKTLAYSSFQAIPRAKITWRYRDTYINNGSTLLNEIDLRHYYHVEKDVSPGMSKI